MKNIKEEKAVRLAELESVRARAKTLSDEIATLEAVEKHGGKATLMNLLAGELEVEQPEMEIPETPEVIVEPEPEKPRSWKDKIKTEDAEEE